MIALPLALLVGLPAARLADRDAPLLRLIGEAMLLGIAICSAVLFAMSCTGIAWTFGRAASIVLAITVVLALLRHGRQVHVEKFHAVDLLTIATLIGYALYATLAPPPEIDFIASWGLKAVAFARHGGVDWAFLQNPWYRWDHPDYPPLLPLAFDFMTLASGKWAPDTLGWLYPYLAAGLILILRSLFEEELGSPLRAAVATFAIAPLAMSPWIGIGEAPLIAYGTAGILMARRRSMTAAAIFLGCATMSKNEGTALLIAAAAALVVSRRFADLLRLWPAVLIALPWYIARSAFSLTTDIATGSVLARALVRLRAPGELVMAFATYRTGATLLWIGLAAALLLTVRWAAAEIFALGCAAIQFVFYLGAYVITGMDVAWHVRWSWERLVTHVAALLAFVCIVLLWRFVARPERPA